MAHKYTCLACGAVIAQADFDCEFDTDHDFELCPVCMNDDLPESEWLAVTDTGRKLPFTLAPGVTEDFALQYAKTHPGTFGLDTVNESVVAVEAN